MFRRKAREVQTKGKQSATFTQNETSADCAYASAEARPPFEHETGKRKNRGDASEVEPTKAVSLEWTCLMAAPEWATVGMTSVGASTWPPLAVAVAWPAVTASAMAVAKFVTVVVCLAPLSLTFVWPAVARYSM